MKPYHCTTAGQMDMCHRAGHTATCNMLRDAIKAMEHKRHGMLESWRKAGALDGEWGPIAEYDQAIDSQTQILRDMEGW